MADAPASNFLRHLEDDGHHLPTIKEHSFEKFRRHNLYAGMFARSMKNRWPQRAYLGLYSGAGRARVERTGEIVETTAMSVLRLSDPFTKYIFVDNDPECTAALEARSEALPVRHDISLLTGDVNECLEDIRRVMPRFNKEHGLLSFCFVDPFDANLKFRTLRMLAQYRMDFLILLAVGVDVRRNFRRYYENPADTRLAELLDRPNWRDEFDPARENVVRFVLRVFDENMTALDYQMAKPAHHHPVMARGTGVLQYILVLYSRHSLAQTFWESALAAADPQLDLGLS